MWNKCFTRHKLVNFKFPLSNKGSKRKAEKQKAGDTVEKKSREKSGGGETKD